MDSSHQTGDSRYTAVKTEPLGTTLLMLNEDVPEFEALQQSVWQQFKPESMTEKLTANWLVSHHWRIRQVKRWERGLYIIGRQRLGAHLTDEELRESTEPVDEKSKTTFAKQFKQLDKQTRFLEQRLKKDTKELNEMLKKNPRSKNRGLFLVPKREKPPAL